MTHITSGYICVNLSVTLPGLSIGCDSLSASVFSSVVEREDWFHTLSRAIADHAAGLCTFGGPCSEVRKVKKWMLNTAIKTPHLIINHIMHL